jgi:hypothetical protein
MTTRSLNTSSAVYKAAVYLEKNGPTSIASLFVAVDFGSTKTRTTKLKYGYQIGWLEQRPDGLIDLTELAIQRLASKPAKTAYIGEITPAQYRPNFRASSGLSKQYRTNSRGTRSDIPDWSRRPDGFGFKNIGGR